LALSLSCAAKKKPESKNPTPADKAITSELLKERLKWLDLRWEILQKDNPPQTETGMFRIAVGEAKALVAENKLSQAEPKITAAEDWLNQNEERYFYLHKQAITTGTLKEDPAKLWAEAEKFFARESERFLAGDKELASLYSRAGFREGEVAVEAAIASELPSADKVDYCRKLAARHTAVFDNVGSEQFKGLAKKLIDDRVTLMGKQIGWCLSGTVPVCELATVRSSVEDYHKAKKVIDDSWKEINALVKIGNEIYPGQFKAPDLEANITAWTTAQNEYFAKLGGQARQVVYKDYAAQQQEELAKQKETLDKYNRYYCPDPGQDASVAGLKLQNTDLKMEETGLVLRILIINDKPDPIYKPKVRLCGGIVSDEFDVGYPRFPGNYQTSFSIPTVAYILEQSSSDEMELPYFWALITFEDADGKPAKVKADLKQK